MAPTKPSAHIDLIKDDEDADASEVVENSKRKERQERFSTSGGSRSDASSHATAAKASHELPKVPKKDNSRKNSIQKEQSEASHKARGAEKEKGRGGASVGNQKSHRMSDAENHPRPERTEIIDEEEDLEFISSNPDPSSASKASTSDARHGAECRSSAFATQGVTGSKKGGAGLGSRRKEDFSNAASQACGAAAAKRRDQQQAQPAPRSKNTQSDLSINFQELELRVLKIGKLVSAHQDLKMEFVRCDDAKQWAIKISGHHLDFVRSVIDFKACDLEQIILYPYRVNDPADNTYARGGDQAGMLTLKVHQQKLQEKLWAGTPIKDNSFVLYFKPYDDFITYGFALRQYLSEHHREFNNFTEMGEECKAQEYGKRLSESRMRYLQEQASKERSNGHHQHSKRVTEDQGSSTHYIMSPPLENSTSNDRPNGSGSGASRTPARRAYGRLGGPKCVLRGEGGQSDEGHSDRNGARSSLYNLPIGRHSPRGIGSDDEETIGTEDTSGHGQGRRRSTRQNCSTADPEPGVSSPASPHEKYDDHHVLVEYPVNSNGKNTVTVTGQDFVTLQPTVFLNDTVIDFYVKYIECELLSADQRSQCHFFGSYFWRKLSEGGSAENAHANVAKWTRRVDIFSKDFLFVPICEQLHWTLAIICFPAGIKLIDDLSINFRKRSEEFCSILYMDSMGNFMKKALVSLTDYLRLEYRAKHGEMPKAVPDPKYSAFADDPDFEPVKRLYVGRNVKVPQQPNGYDCGIFVLEYIQKFALEFTKSPGKGEQGGAFFDWRRWTDKKSAAWFTKTKLGTEKRKLIKDILRKLEVEYTTCKGGMDAASSRVGRAADSSGAGGGDDDDVKGKRTLKMAEDDGERGVSIPSRRVLDEYDDTRCEGEGEGEGEGDVAGPEAGAESCRMDVECSAQQGDGNSGFDDHAGGTSPDVGRRPRRNRDLIDESKEVHKDKDANADDANGDATESDEDDSDLNHGQGMKGTNATSQGTPPGTEVGGCEPKGRGTRQSPAVADCGVAAWDDADSKKGTAEKRPRPGGGDQTRGSNGKRQKNSSK